MPTFAQLQTSVSKRLLDPEHTAVELSDVKAAINSAIKTWKQKRFWFNEAEDTITLTPNDPDFTSLLPDDFLIEIPDDGFAILYSDMRYPLTKVKPWEYDRMNVQSPGRPAWYTWVGGQYLLYYYPDIAYDLLVKYLKDYDDLVDDADTNDFTENADQLIMDEALFKLYAEFRQDEKMSSYYEDQRNKEEIILLSRTRKNTASGRLTIDSYL